MAFAQCLSDGSTPKESMCHISSIEAAAVVSAYRDGGVIVDKIKQRRLARQAPPPTRLLEVSLARGPEAVEQAKEDGIERFGTRYAQGDSLAVTSLKDILIDLQGSLIKHLRQAQEDDDMTDFTVLVDASDMGRIRTVTVLNELYKRIAEGNTVGQAPFGDMGAFTNPHMAGQYGHMLSNVSPQGAMNPPSPPAGVGRVEQPIVAHAETAREQEGPRTSPKPGLLDRFRRKSSTEESTSAQSSRRSSRILPRRDANPPSNRDDKTLPLSPMASPRSVIDEDNPWATEGSKHIPVPHEPPPNTSLSRASTLVPSIKESKERTLTANSAWSATTASSAWSTSTSKVRTISPYELHGGFCKGAYKLQVHEKDAMKLQQHSGAQTVEDYFWACSSSKCAFEGPARVAGTKWVFDDTIRESHGVRYRWLFLAKSHIALSKAQKGRYDYGCLFCIYDKYESPVFHGIEELMEHVGLHRGTPIAVATLQKTKCINGRLAGYHERFDVNFKPLEAMPRSVPADEDAYSPSQPGMMSAAASDRGSWTTDGDETLASVDAWRDSV
ncbi:MAG: hypothetical protein LQ348_005659 [Seirophora lacunosa]|nr:MAG: hypothetical protein LQ348_005659 [Seirophora lacunosa]